MKKSYKIGVIFFCIISIGIAVLKLIHDKDLTMVDWVASILICIVSSVSLVACSSISINRWCEYTHYKESFEKLQNDYQRYIKTNSKYGKNEKILIYDKIIRAARNIRKQGRKYIKKGKFGPRRSKKIKEIIGQTTKIINNQF